MPKAKAPTHLSAEVWRSLRHEWLWVYHDVVPHHGEWSAEIVVPAGVFFVERGEVRIRADKTETVVARGHAFFSAPGLRRQWFAPGTRLLSVGLRSQWPDGTPLFGAGLNVTTEAPTLRLATRQLFRRIHSGRRYVAYREATQPAAHSAAEWAAREAAYLVWFVAFIDTLQSLGVRPEARAGSSRRRVDELIAWLNTRPLEQNAPTLPPDFPLGRRRADQLLQQHLGIGTRLFLERRRLGAARERLASGQGTLKETAFALGFRHASHFTAWFRRHTGIAPSAYRMGGVEAA